MDIDCVRDDVGFVCLVNRLSSKMLMHQRIASHSWCCGLNGTREQGGGAVASGITWLWCFPPATTICPPAPNAGAPTAGFLPLAIGFTVACCPLNSAPESSSQKRAGSIFGRTP